MSKNRQSNFELLRIILMIAVPLYHMMIYAGIIYMPYGTLTPEALFICSGSAIVADYAFMALSAYFMIDSKGKPIVSRFLELAFQIVFLYIFKYIMIRKVLAFPQKDYYVNDFFLKGAWWFIYAYLIILVIYPILNHLIFSLKLYQLKGICVVLGLLFLWNGIRNDVSTAHDILAFVFTYFVVGYLKRMDFKSYFGMKTNKSTMLAIYLVGAFATFFFLWWVKYPGNLASAEVASDVVRVLVGKYSFIQFIMGIAVFLFFKSLSMKQNPVINNISKNVFYVFMLHETVMAIYWYFGKMRTIDDVLPYQNLVEVVLWALIYIGSSFVFALIIRCGYEKLLGQAVKRMVSAMCSTKIVTTIEEFYRKIEV